MKEQWHSTSEDEVLLILTSRRSGLTSSEAVDRLKKYGPNELAFKKPSVVMRFLRQFNNPLVYVLLLAAGITRTLFPLLGWDNIR